MPTVSETKDMHYKTIEKRITTIKALEHFISSKELANFVSDIYIRMILFIMLWELDLMIFFKKLRLELQSALVSSKNRLKDI